MVMLPTGSVRSCTGSLQTALGLSNRKSFRECHHKPAFTEGLIEMTIPNKGCQWLVLLGDK